jgi:hypothetical protein
MAPYSTRPAWAGGGWRDGARARVGIRRPDQLYQAVDRLNDTTVDGWPMAMRKIARDVAEVSPEIHSAFLAVWIQMKMLPLKVGDHRALCTALRVLMPRYAGPPVWLYRGANARERRRRIYGISWTSDIEIAEKFAQERRYGDESVLLETVASPEAIICAISEASGHLTAENEYAVDGGAWTA